MEIAKTYNPAQAEQTWYNYWLENQFFKSIESFVALICIEQLYDVLNGKSFDSVTFSIDEFAAFGFSIRTIRRRVRVSSASASRVPAHAPAVRPAPHSCWQPGHLAAPVSHSHPRRRLAPGRRSYRSEGMRSLFQGFFAS